MADTERTKAELLTIFADGQAPGAINPQDMRDYVVTADIVNTRFSSGLIEGGIVTINAGDPAKIDISAGVAFFADNFTNPLDPVRIKVSWSAFIAETIPLIASTTFTVFGLDLSSGSAVVVTRQQAFTAEERRDFVLLVAVGHPDFATVAAIGSAYQYALDERQTIDDLCIAIGSINTVGNVYGPNASADLTMDKSAGEIVSLGFNYHNSRKTPNTLVIPLFSPVPFIFYLYQDGVGGFTVAGPQLGIDPNNWDDGTGTLNPVQPNKFTIQRIWLLGSSGATDIHYGQAEYGTLEGARLAINFEEFNRHPELTTGFRAWLIVQQGTTDLTVLGDAEFLKASKFGDVLRD